MNTPKIRFKGFKDDWEQRKLDTVAKFSKGSGYSKGDLIETGTPIILYGRLYTKYETSISDVDTYVEAKEGSVYSKGGEVIVPASGETAEDIARAATVDKSGILLGGDLNVVMPNEDINSAFLAISISNGNSQRELAKKAQGKSVVHIHNEEIRNLIVPFPIKAEQNRIVDYFSTLDHLITLHQRKCDETKQLKKFMLQKMFPKNGEKNPEIRFEGFTDAWEQRKLDTVAKFSKGSGYSKGDLIETGTPIILYGRLYTKYETSISDVDTYVEAKEGSVYSKGGEVIVPASGETAEDIARAATVDKSGILLGGDLNVVMPNEDINSAFLAISISNGNSQRELAKKAQGKSVVHIHNEEIRNLIVPFPIKAEQNRIVDYFSTLDHLITLHQRKCEKLKALKKFMLQNMFI